MRTTVLWLIGLALAAPAYADPPGGMGPMAAQLWREAEALESADDWRGAARKFEMVGRAEPGWIQASVRRARALVAAGDLVKAERAFTLAVDEAELHGDDNDVTDVVKELAALLLSLDRQGDAATLLEPYEEAYGGDGELTRLLALAHTEDNPERAATLLRAYLGYGQNEQLPTEPTADLARAVFLALSALGEHEAAKASLDQVMRVVPDSRESLEHLLDDALMREQARRLANSAGKPLSPTLRGRLEDLRRRVHEPDILGAVDALITEAPRSAEVRGLRAEVLVRAGRLAEADAELRVAEDLDPLDTRWPHQLSQVLHDGFSGRYDSEAARALERALSLQPERGDLWLKKGELELSLGETVHAHTALERARRHGDAPTAQRAEWLLAGLDRKRRAMSSTFTGRACPERIPEGNCDALYHAIVYNRRGGPGDRKVALQYAKDARDGVEDWVRGVNLEASIHRAIAEGPSAASTHRATSLALYARSLELKPEQPTILVHLGKLHERNGEQELAVDRWQQAVALDSAEGGAAHFYLARHYASERDLWTAEHHLDAYFSGAANGALPPALHTRAEELRDDVRRTIWTIYTAAGVLGASVLAAPVVWWGMRRPGHGLERLLDRAPGSWRDVTRICSAIRHEVLKHNTTLLDGVADALDAGDPDPAVWAAGRLFDDKGAVPRFDAYLTELRELARRHGVRLDLRRRDPVFAPLCAAMGRLSALRKPLERGQPRIADDLRALSRQLNGTSYRALGAFIRRMCLLPVERSLIDNVWSQTSGEAAFVQSQLPTLTVVLPDEDLWLRMFRSDLFDILSNVLRNGAQASIDVGATEMLVSVEVEEDWITGLERVAFRVGDRAPARITTALIRSRYIERGLGLTVDLISRSGGSIHVEEQPGWSKAVVVRLPRAEQPGEDA